MKAGAALGVVVLAGIAAVLWWFVAVYDTAAARCDRGDAEACSVLAARAEAQQQAVRDAAEAEAAAAVGEAIAAESERADRGECYVGRDGADVTLRVSGDSADATCGLLADELPDAEWRVTAEPAASDPVCTVPYGGPAGTEQTLTVLDTGLAVYGRELCQELGAPGF